MRVHHYVAPEDEGQPRCRFCNLGALQVFTDKEDIENAIRCLQRQLTYMDAHGIDDWEENPVQRAANRASRALERLREREEE